MMLKHKFSFVLICAVALYGASGKSLHVSQGNDGIIGGKEVDITQYPHQVVVLLGGDLLCGGSILNEEYVLTAAHCGSLSKNPEEYTIRVGSTYYMQGGVLHEVSDITIHPGYNRQTLDYDVAVFKLSEKIDINGSTTKAVQLAKSDSSLKPKNLVDVTGWGMTETGNISNVLKAVTVPVMDKEHCQKVYNDYQVKITDRMLCAGYEEPGQNSCFGDSGGPLIDQKTSVQFGVVSFTVDSCIMPGIPNVYAYIPAVRDWIHQVTGV